MHLFLLRQKVCFRQLAFKSLYTVKLYEKKREKTTDQKWTNLHKNDKDKVKPVHWGY